MTRIRKDTIGRQQPLSTAHEARDLGIKRNFKEHQCFDVRTYLVLIRR